MTEFMDPDHEAMGDAAGDLIDPTLDAPSANAGVKASSDWDPRPPGVTDQASDSEGGTDPKGGSH